MSAFFFTIIKRDLLIAYRHGFEFLSPMIFFAIIVILFPLTMTVDAQKLQSMAPGILWIGFLFASSLSMENLFVNDFDDGTLEQLFLCKHPLIFVVLAKLCAHWLKTSLPLIVLASLLSPLLYLSNYVTLVLILTLMLGTPVICLIGAIGAALTLGLRNKSVLLMLLICPLYIPVLIFGTSAVSNAIQGLNVVSSLALLGALFTLACTFAPLAISGALRICIE